jgi:putative alpha-1,2-mannosidase
MHLSGGKTFEIIARGASRDNKYIRSATLNGQPLEGPFLSHEALMAGGRLVLEMGSEPDKSWGK